MGHCLLVAFHILLNCREVRPGVTDVHPMFRIWAVIYSPIPISSLVFLTKSCCSSCFVLYILLLAHSPDFFSPESTPLFFNS